MAVSGSDVRRARAFLFGRAAKGISPRKFAAAAQELSKSFTELLRMIMKLRSGGQGQGPAPVAAEIAMKEAA